jgi:hypothetical protein
MKTTQPVTAKKWSGVIIDSSLNELRNQVRFPEKLAQANKILKMVKLPPNRNKQL